MISLDAKIVCRTMPKHNPFGKIGDSSPPESPAKKGNEPEPERTLLVKHDVCVYRIPPQVLNICHDDDDNHDDDDEDEHERTLLVKHQYYH